MKTLTAIVILAVIGLIIFCIIYPVARYNAGYEHAVNVIGRQVSVFTYRDTILMQGKAKKIHDTIYTPPIYDTTAMQITECVDLLSDCDKKLWEQSQPVGEILIDTIGGIHNITYIPLEKMFFEDYQYTHIDSVRTIYIQPSKLPYYIAGAAVVVAILSIALK